MYLNKNKEIYIENIYCSININNIENYLKRIESLKKTINSKIEIFLIPNSYIYDEQQLFWGLFISKNKFLEKTNVSKKLWTELLLTLDCTDQINRINKDWYIKTGKNKYFLLITDSKKIKKTDIKKIIKNLEVKTLERVVYLKKKAKEYYKIKDNKDILNKIIEKMAVSNLKN